MDAELQRMYKHQQHQIQICVHPARQLQFMTGIHGDGRAVVVEILWNVLRQKAPRRRRVIHKLFQLALQLLQLGEEARALTIVLIQQTMAKLVHSPIRPTRRKLAMDLLVISRKIQWAGLAAVEVVIQIVFAKQIHFAQEINLVKTITFTFTAVANFFFH